MPHLVSFAAPLAALAVIGASFLSIPLPPEKSAAELGELAIIYFKLDDARSAGLFEQALAMEPGNVRIHYGAGAAALEAKRYAEAERELDAVLKADPKHIDATFAQAVVYQKTARPERMEAMLKRMIELNPQDSRPYDDLAQMAIHRRDYRIARDYLKVYLDLVPTRARKARRNAEAKFKKLNEMLGEAPKPSPAPAQSPTPSLKTK